MLEITFYDQQGGHKVVCKNIRAEDAEFFTRNQVNVSMEELAGENVLYAGPAEYNEEEGEIIVFSAGRSCEDSMHELAVEYKHTFGDVNE